MGGSPRVTSPWKLQDLSGSPDSLQISNKSRTRIHEVTGGLQSPSPTINGAVAGCHQRTIGEVQPSLEPSPSTAIKIIKEPSKKQHETSRFGHEDLGHFHHGLGEAPRVGGIDRPRTLHSPIGSPRGSKQLPQAPEDWTPGGSRGSRGSRGRW